MSERGTSNTNARGSSADRAARRAWLVEHYAADVQVFVQYLDGIAGEEGWPVPLDYNLPEPNDRWTYELLPACRCYRCGRLLTFATVTVDRILPGCQGGTYRRSNIRPACAECNSSTGGRTRRNPAKGKSLGRRP